jgi:7-carboxy-7-deazaguanine synthase
MSVEEIVAEVERIGCGCRLVELTGGEPLLQKEIGRLAEELLEREYRVLCETSGSIDVGVLPAGVVKIMDVKCPGSGESENNLWGNLEKLGPGDEIKFVIADRSDYEWALSVIDERELAGQKLLFAPAWGELELERLAEWMLEDDAPGRLQPQLHKYIWDADETGV